MVYTLQIFLYLDSLLFAYKQRQKKEMIWVYVEIWEEKGIIQEH